MHPFLAGVLWLVPGLALAQNPAAAARPSATKGPPPAPVVLRGHFAHAPAGDTVRLAYLTHFGRGRVKAPLGRAGDFEFTLRDVAVGTPAEVECAGQRTRVYLTPGDHLTMTLDYARFDETLRYTGDGANANNYLARSLWQFKYGPAEAGPRPRDDEAIAFTPEQMRRCADAFRAKSHAFLAAWALSHPLPPAFRAAAAVHIDLEWALALLEYPALHNRLTRQQAAFPDAYYAFLAQLPPHTLDPYPRRDLGAEDNGLVMGVLLAYSFRLVPDGQLRADPADAERLYARAIAELGQVAADEAMLLFIDRQLQVEGNWAGALAAYPAFRTWNQDSARAKFLRRQISQRRALQPGQVAPGFALADHAGQPTSLEQWRGKVVYLDFWGTWCKPCLEEMPASVALRRRFLGQDVVFVYVDVSDTETAWRRSVATHRLLGENSVHVRSPNQFVPAAYQVNAYPRYVLIGRDGRLILPVAPRPSNAAEAAAAIEAALAQRP
ncbi:TlpA family protein disulfide reductase [Hymenobacter frigidus]|nr:TlpA disulfide reductase family protein [Hymenobacter frigidus]